MKFNPGNRFTLFAITIVAITLSSFSMGWAQASETVEVASKEKESIERIVREYLLKNPSIVREALQALQIQEEKEKQRLAAESLRNLKRDIYFDTDSPALGAEKADVPIVVFFDYNCGHCKNTLPGLKDLLLQDPSLRIIYKEFPIMGPQSQSGALAALAAKRQGKYAEFHFALMTAPEINADVIKAISDSLKLDYPTLQQDMADPSLNEAINRNLRLASKLGINGTPGYIVGDQIIPGAIDSETLAKIVAAERAKLKEAVNITKDVGSAK